MEFKNIEKFKAWLSKIVKSKVYDFDAYLDDIERSINVKGCEGMQSYELSCFESITNKTELYYYQVEIIQDDDDFETIVTF